MLFWSGFPEKLPWLASSSFSNISSLPPSPLLELPSTTNFACSLWTTCRWRGASDHLAPVNDQLCLVTNLSCLVTAHNLTTPVAWLFAGYLVYNWAGGEMSAVITRPSHLAKCHPEGLQWLSFLTGFLICEESDNWRFHWLQLSNEFDKLVRNKLVRNSVPPFEKINENYELEARLSVSFLSHFFHGEHPFAHASSHWSL